MKRAALYVRVSTEEQKNHGLSVDSQIAALKEYCASNGLQEVGLYNDAGISARKRYTGRPALLQLINDCESGKVDIVLFTKLDRWFRSVADYYEVQSKLEKCGVPWRAIWEDYETETSSGVFKVNIMLSVAQSESDRTSERIKAVNEYRRAKGDFVGGTAPLGYKVQKNALLKDDATKECVEDFFKTYLLTFNVMRSLESATLHGINITRQKARRMLLSDVYAGDAYGYKCEPYITEEQHKVILESLENRKVEQLNPDRVYLFSGLLRCPKCGGVLSSRLTSTSRNGKTYKYKSYRCSRNMRHAGCDNSSTVFETTVERFLLSSWDNIETEKKDNPKISAKQTDNQKEIANLEAKLKRVGIRFEDGDIEIEEYRLKRDQLKFEIKKLKAASTVKTAPQLPAGWRNTYCALDDEHKKSFWQRLYKTIIYHAETKTFTFDFR